jgi:hypothetical protein
VSGQILLLKVLFQGENVNTLLVAGGLLISYFIIGSWYAQSVLGQGCLTRDAQLVGKTLRYVWLWLFIVGYTWAKGLLWHAIWALCALADKITAFSRLLF